MSIISNIKSKFSSITSKIGDIWQGVDTARKDIANARPLISFASTLTKGISKRNQERLGNFANAAVESGTRLLTSATDALISRLVNNVDPATRTVMREERAAKAQADAQKLGAVPPRSLPSIPSFGVSPVTIGILAVAGVVGFILIRRSL